MFQWHLPILVELFELGATVLEPDFHLNGRRKELLVSLSACLKDPSTQPSLEKAKRYPSLMRGKLGKTARLSHLSQDLSFQLGKNSVTWNILLARWFATSEAGP